MLWNNKGKQFDSLAQHFSKRSRIYLYGNPELCCVFLNYMLHPLLVEAIDGFVIPIGKGIDTSQYEFMCFDDSILFNNHDENHLIVLCQEGDLGERIKDRLNRAGYVRGWDYFLSTDSIWEDMNGLNHPFIPIFSLCALDKIYVSSGCIVPDTKCNLNCRDCLNFTPYIKHHITRDLKDVCEDVDLYFKWVDYSERYQVSGGEPLLYENFKEITAYIGEKYRSKIGIYETVMNGTIVPRKDICEIIKKYDMTVYLDNYTMSIPQNIDKRKEIIDILDSYRIPWIDNTVDKWFSLNVRDTDNSKMSQLELTQYFDYCGNPWHSFENGKLYSCNFLRFASKAGLYEEEENDYFDLNSMTVDKRMELLEFMLGYTDKGYVNFCKKCAGWSTFNKLEPVQPAIQSKGKLYEEG